MSESSHNQDQSDETVSSTLRALVSTKEAGVIIGKAGKNVAEIREQTGVRAGVSKPVPNCHDRVLTITGSIEGISRAFALCALALVESPPTNLPRTLSPPPPQGAITIRLLVPHTQMGSIIGRQGAKIKHIQESCNVRMVASKDFLHQSTERVVEVQGEPGGIFEAIGEIVKCLLEDPHQSSGTILYTPHAHSYTSSSSNSHHHSYSRSNGNISLPSPLNESSSPNGGNAGGSDEQLEEHISFPGDMVGCLIGKRGSKIQEIRRVSGARISIAQENDQESGERSFTITGSAAATERALKLLYDQLEEEKIKRTQQQHSDEEHGDSLEPLVGSVDQLKI